METVQDGSQRKKLSDLKQSAQEKFRIFSHHLGESLQDHIIGPMEKGMELAKIQSPSRARCRRSGSQSIAEVHLLQGGFASRKAVSSVWFRDLKRGFSRSFYLIKD